MSTISTTSTSASILNWYIYCSRSFFISTELSSNCATVNNRIRHRDQTLFRFRRKAIRNRRPPSWIIHQISMVPSWICLLSGKLSIFLGTITAHCRASAMAIVPIYEFSFEEIHRWKELTYEWKHRLYNYRNLFAIVLANRERWYSVVNHLNLPFEFYINRISYSIIMQEWETYSALIPSSASLADKTSAKPWTFAWAKPAFNN